MDNDMYKFTHELHVKVSENLDEAIIHVLKMVDNDIHHELFVDKNKIADMLRRNRPTAVVREDFPFRTLYSCPSCERRIFTTEKYCSKCGQALDWTGVDKR